MSESDFFESLGGSRPIREERRGQIILGANQAELSVHFVPPVLERLLPRSLAESGVVLPELDLERVERVDLDNETSAIAEIVYRNTGEPSRKILEQGYNQMALKISYLPPTGYSRDKLDSL